VRIPKSKFPQNLKHIRTPALRTSDALNPSLQGTFCKFKLHSVKLSANRALSWYGITYIQLSSTSWTDVELAKEFGSLRARSEGFHERLEDLRGERERWAGMAPHARPKFVLYGASMTEYSFCHGGWGAALADLYCRKVLSPSLRFWYFCYFGFNWVCRVGLGFVELGFENPVGLLGMWWVLCLSSSSILQWLVDLGSTMLFLTGIHFFLVLLRLKKLFTNCNIYMYLGFIGDSVFCCNMWRSWSTFHLKTCRI